MWRIKTVFFLLVTAVVGWQYDFSCSPQPRNLVVTNDADGRALSDLLQPSGDIAHFETSFSDDLKPLFDGFMLSYEDGEQAVWDAYYKYSKEQGIRQEEVVSTANLLWRYIDYKKGLKNFDYGVETVSLREIEDSLSRLTKFRDEMFNTDDKRRLFSDEEQYDRLAIARLSILDDSQLSNQQKLDLLQEQLKHWPDDMRMAIDPTIKLRKLAYLDQEDNIANLYDEYSAEFGGEVADRLLNVKQEELEWLQRVVLFQQKQAELIARYKESDPEILAVEVNNLKNSMFSENEQKRLPGLCSPKRLKGVN